MTRSACVPSPQCPSTTYIVVRNHMSRSTVRSALARLKIRIPELIVREVDRNMKKRSGATQAPVVLARAPDPELPRLRIPVPLHALEDAQGTSERLGRDVDLDVVVGDEFAVDGRERGPLELTERGGVGHCAPFSRKGLPVLTFSIVDPFLRDSGSRRVSLSRISGIPQGWSRSTRWYSSPGGPPRSSVLSEPFMAHQETSPDMLSKAVVAAVILAGGHGTRFGQPKYSLTLRGRRLVDMAVDLVRPLCRDVVVVLPAGHSWDGDPVSGVAAGGATRTESLRAAIPLLRPDVEVVVTHDCVRPLASADQIQAVIAAVLAGADAAIPAWQSPDTLKRLRDDGSIEHLGREGILVVQSPSAYRRATLQKVFETLEDVPLDETIGVEMIGGRVVPVRGDRWSQHLVDERDLRMFERLIGRKPQDAANPSEG